MANKHIGLIILSCLWLLHSVFGQTNVKSTTNTNCSNPYCSCCLETANCITALGDCGGQCRNGYHGVKCSLNCPSNCVACKDRDNPNDDPSYWRMANCTSCKPGYYSTTDYYQCQFECYDNCAICRSATDCTSCNNGYYQANSRCLPCATGCANCSSDIICNQCKDGYYYSDMGNNNLICTLCSNGCQNICDQLTGSCRCRAGFNGEKCDQCAPNFQPYPNCSECASQYHGTYCNMTCPSNCKNKTCYQDSGACKNGCDWNFTGQDCTICSVGFYGIACNKYCSENCLDGTCDQSTGNCHKCKNNHMGNMCNSCVNGKYGDDCNIPCPTNCNSTCQQRSGKCDSCNDGFTGDKCCLKGPGCQNCSSTFICSICVAGFHGENCDQKCPTNCGDNICDKLNGTCRTCADGFNGDNCTLASTKTTADSSVPVAAVAGGLIGGLVVLIAIGVLFFIFFKRRSINKNKGLTTTARTDTLTTDRVNANDAAFIAAPNESNTYETLMNTFDTTNDMAPYTSLNNYEAMELPIEMEEAIRQHDLSNRGMTADRSKLDKAIKPATAMIPGKPIKKANTSQTPKHHVSTVENGSCYELFEEDIENDYYNSQTSPETHIAVSELAAYLDKRDFEFFNTEFAKLPKGLIKPTDAASLESNLGKNHYTAIYPYDETRVVLAGPGSDFINACYIEGYTRKRRYIASFGPFARATEDFKTFWRMVWQEKSEKIVMITNLIENGAVKCEQYWPDKNSTLTYGDVTVKCHGEDVYAVYSVRSFTVCKGTESRSLHHIHYTDWPDKGVPDDVTSLVEFRNKVNSTKTNLNGPIIIHCSAGVGRTGIYIALDILTLRGKQKGVVDIFDCVKKLRQQRTVMVQTAEQYEYLYRALVHTLFLGSENIPTDRFIAYTASLSVSDFDRMSHCSKMTSDEETAAIARNKALIAYNRQGADIPGDINRPRLHFGRTTEDNAYINALFVNSFHRKNQFILAQTPLVNTVDDFLTLVLQENCCCIVSMDASDLLDKTISTYVPAENQTLSTDAYEVKSTWLDCNKSYSLRTLKIKSKNTSSTITVQHLLFANWPHSSKTPNCPTEFLTFVKQIQKLSEETTQSSPVLVHCSTGSERSALPCVVLNLLEKIETEHEVSVINTVRQVKVRRSKAIPNKEQFKFCRQCVSAYIQSCDLYYNLS